MTINPRDYDPNELREMARERGESPAGLGDAGGAPDPDDLGGGSQPSAGTASAVRSDLYRELMPLEAGVAGGLTKPYLGHLPDTYAGELLVFEWLEFLLSNAGYRGVQDALGYYESIGWLTDDAESDLSDYLLGIEGEAAADGGDLDVDDHMMSLVYIAKLVSMQ
jgi:flagellar protein FlaE